MDNDTQALANLITNQIRKAQHELQIAAALINHAGGANYKISEEIEGALADVEDALYYAEKDGVFPDEAP